MRLAILSKAGLREGIVDLEARTIEASGNRLKRLLKRYEEDGVPRAVGKVTDEWAFDGFELIGPKHKDYFNAVGEALRQEGYQFSEIIEEE